MAAKGADWIRPPGPDPTVATAGSERTLNGRSFTFDGVDAVQRGTGGGRSCGITRRTCTPRVRHYVCYPGAPVIETRTDDLSLAIRSRMRGTPGRTWQADDLSEADRAGIRSELDIYKQIRNTLADASAEVLTPQVAFENPGAGSRATVLPRELRPDVLDELSSVDTGVLGSALGSELSASGIEIDSSPRSRGQVLELAAPRRRNFGAVTDTRGKNVCIMHV